MQIGFKNKKELTRRKHLIILKNILCQHLLIICGTGLQYCLQGFLKLTENIIVSRVLMSAIAKKWQYQKLLLFGFSRGK